MKAKELYDKIDHYVAEWHEGDGEEGQNLPDYLHEKLGITEEDFAKYVELSL